MNILRDSIIEFDLEQITPMIHFQGEEKGAGIRASDLKPRFDAFIQRYLYDFETEEQKKKLHEYTLRCENSGNNNKMSEANRSEKFSFDYKVRVRNESKDKKITFYKGKDKSGKNTFYGSFYGQLDDNKVSYYEQIKITFICSDLCLSKQIKEFFPVFLAVNSFGLRNNKGYGYFKLKQNREEQILDYIKKYHILEKEYLRRQGYSNENAHRKEEGIGVYQLNISNQKEINCEKSKKVQSLLDSIKLFHQILKSGLNHDGYIPSFMLKKSQFDKMAALEEKAVLEKKAFKLFLKNNGYDISALTKKGDRYGKMDVATFCKKRKYYVRGLLGLAPFYVFGKVGDKNKNQKECKIRFNVKISNIERFASPIRYLPISYQKVIIVVDYGKIEEFRNEAKNVEFVLNPDKEPVKNRVDGSCEKSFSAVIPSANQYSVHQFFKEGGIIAKELKKINESIANEFKKKSEFENVGKMEYGVVIDIE